MEDKQKKEERMRRLSDKIVEVSQQFPEVSFAKLSRIAKRMYEFGREEGREEMIEKACEWLGSNVNCSDWLLDFRKYMEK